MRSPGGGEGDLSGPAIGATKNTLPAITVCNILVNNTYPYNVCSATRISWSRVTRAHAPRQVTIPPVYTVAGVALYSPGKMRSCTVFVDMDGDGRLDRDEPQTITDANVCTSRTANAVCCSFATGNIYIFTDWTVDAVQGCSTARHINIRASCTIDAV